jgi:protein disulfide-isomerase-like protein
MKFSIIALALMALPASAIDLSQANYDEVTAGKVVFIKMFAPWCGHCKKMKPDWDKLMDEYKDSETQLIADADCTADGKPVCDANGVKGFPTLKYGDPNDLQDYQGARTYDAMKKFIDEELKPTCSPGNLALCDDDKKKEIEILMALDGADLDAKIAVEEKKIEDAESTFKAGVEKLQETYQTLMAEKEATEAKVKESGMGLMKSVRVAKNKATAGSDEL